MSPEELLASCPLGVWRNQRRGIRLDLKNGHSIIVNFDLTDNKFNFPRSRVDKLWGDILGVSKWKFIKRYRHAKEISEILQRKHNEIILTFEEQAICCIRLLDAIKIGNPGDVVILADRLAGMLMVENWEAAKNVGWNIWLKNVVETYIPGYFR